MPPRAVLPFLPVESSRWRQRIVAFAAPALAHQGMGFTTKG